MRTAASTLSRSSANTPTSTSTPPNIIPTIRLITATPSAYGSSTNSPSSIFTTNSTDPAWPTPLRPKDPSPKKRLVPKKKSKLNLLNTRDKDKDQDKAKDLSDVLRRVGVSSSAAASASARGFEIYVDPADDPEIGEIVILKKRKSRAALEDVRWGPAPAALGEVTNVPTAERGREGDAREKEKAESKWWTIGRGRKDSKEKEKEKENKEKTVRSTLADTIRAITPDLVPSRAAAPDPYPRSKTPDPTKPEPPRARFNSLGSSTLLADYNPSVPTILTRDHERQQQYRQQYLAEAPEPRPPPVPVPVPVPVSLPRPVPPPSESSRAGTPTVGLLAVPEKEREKEKGGSIALRAMRSVRSLARIKSWAHMKGEEGEGEKDKEKENKKEGKEKDKDKKDKDKEGKKAKDKEGKEKERKEKKEKKERKERKAREKENAVEEGEHGAVDEGGVDDGTVRKSKSKSKSKSKDPKSKSKSSKSSKLKKDKEKDTEQAAFRLSSSSFEIGSASPLPPRTQPPAFHLPLPTPPLPAPTHTLPLPTEAESDAQAADAPTLGKKKRSILALGLGLPSSLALRLRSGSGASAVSTASHPPPAYSLRAGSGSTCSSLRPLSVSSGGGSRMSSGSAGSGGSGSVRWDEERLESVRAERRRERAEREREREREEREREKDKEKEGGGKRDKKSRSKSGKEKEKESKHSAESRRRTPLSSVFPPSPSLTHTDEYSPPVVRVQAATADGHSAGDDESVRDSTSLVSPPSPSSASTATPVKSKPRARPLSEQMLGRARPRGVYECDSDDGVISVLDAATNDLAQLINKLDLEATPGTPDMTPLQPYAAPAFLAAGEHSLADSPLKRGRTGAALHDVPSVSSLRPYAQSRRNADTSTSAAAHTVTGATLKRLPSADLIGQPITPWRTLLQGLSPAKASPAPRLSGVAEDATPTQGTVRPTHRRTMTPGPEPEPAPVFQPLRPARSRVGLKPSLGSLFSLPRMEKEKEKEGKGAVRVPLPASASFGTFGSGSVSLFSGRGSVKDGEGEWDGEEEEEEGELFSSPMFRRARERLSDKSSRSGSKSKSSSGSWSSRWARGSVEKADGEDNTIPISRETRRVLGMAGTLGGSDGSAYEGGADADGDEDSDIPDELQFILAGQGQAVDDGDTLSFRLRRSPSPGPPTLELPIFRAQLVEEEAGDGMWEGEEADADTKKSFDFTGEIKKLNESGVSRRRSFVEQLENAFRTPAKVDFRYGFELGADAPPLPPLPKFPLAPAPASVRVGEASMPAFDAVVDMKEPSLLHFNMTQQDVEMDVEPEPRSQFESFAVDVREPTLLPGSDSLASGEDDTNDMVLDVDDSVSFAAQRSLATASSSGSRPSDGQLNKAFRFGGRPKETLPPLPVMKDLQSKPQTLSDIIPPPSHARSLSGSSTMDEDDSVLKSIFAKITDIPPRPRANSDSHARPPMSYRHSRHSSGLSFVGFDSFDEVRRGFEFGSDRAPFYPPPSARRANQQKRESLFSIASVSSYGRVINSGSSDPFDYGLPSLQERPSSEDLSMMTSTSVDDTFSFMHHRPRQRVESDASSFYFKPLQSVNRGHRHQDSNFSVTSQAPPVSLFNRSFAAHRHSDSSASASSVAQAYAGYGAPGGGRAVWARHHQEPSMDSVASDFSVTRLGRPGLGDKMFNTEHGMPLTAISASPAAECQVSNGTSFEFDSIMDDDRGSSMEDSLFEKTGRRSAESSSDSVFGYDHHAPPGALLPPNHFRPLSELSLNNSTHSPMGDDDTMISMLGGGYVRRCSVEVTPCPRVEKRKHSIFQGVPQKGFDEYRDSPNKARIVEKPSIASTSSYSFGGERMVRAQRGLFERQSLEENVLVAEGEDLSGSFRFMPVFSRPGPVSRSRSSTYTTSSSGGDTPPLSASDGASISEGSQSSIDLSELNALLSNATHPMTNAAQNRARSRARGHGHRRRISQARASRSSVYETIPEEMSNASPARSFASKMGSSTGQPVFIVDPETASIDTLNPGSSVWDEERGIVALRKYYALRDEAQDTVTESKRQWLDTPFSVFALQSFCPPKHPAGMQALLDHSVQNYGPLPSELRPRRVRSRTQSRVSPYPLAQARAAIANSVAPPSPQMHTASLDIHRIPVPVLQQIPVNRNVDLLSAVPSLEGLKQFPTDMEPKRENAFGLAPAAARPRVGSTARRTALGWAKRSTGKSSTDQKENVVKQASVMTPGENLRLNRPRPRGRPTPASQQRATRV